MTGRPEAVYALSVMAISAQVWRPAALLLAVALAACAQRMVERRDHVVDGVVLLAIAAWLFLHAVRSAPEHGALPSPPTPPCILPSKPWIESGRWRALSFVAAAAFGAIAYLEFEGNTVTVSALTAWLLALGCFVAASAEHRRRLRQPEEPPRGRLSEARVYLALAGIGLVAAFFLFFRLADVPAEMTSDHAEKLLDVHDVLSGRWSIFFPRNTGREALQFYLTAALVQWGAVPFGHLALKIGMAFVGLLAVLFTFLVGRQLYGLWVGLLAAGFLGVSHWHLTLSRAGLRHSLTAAFAVPTLYFLFRALQANRRNDWLACGLVLGMGLHGYTSMRVVPLLVVMLIGIHTLLDLATLLTRGGRDREKTFRVGWPDANSLTFRYWGNALVASCACLLAFLPLLRYMMDNPRVFWYRSLTRVTAAERPLPPDLVSVALENLKNALLMFNYRGDSVWVTTVPFDPALDWVTGGLFVLGITYLGWRVLARQDRWSAYVLLTLLMLLIPSVLAFAFPGENPSVGRAAGAAPIAMLVAAVPLGVVAAHLRSDWRRWGCWAGTAMAMATVAASAVLTYHWYFVRYEAQYRASAWNSREMAATIQAFVSAGGDMGHAYHIGYPHWVDTRTIAINAGDITWRNGITDLNQVQDHPADPAAKLYLLHRDDVASLRRLEALFPRGRARTYSARTPGKDFVVFDVPASPTR